MRINKVDRDVDKVMLNKQKFYEDLENHLQNILRRESFNRASGNGVGMVGNDQANASEENKQIEPPAGILSQLF